MYAHTSYNSQYSSTHAKLVYFIPDNPHTCNSCHSQGVCRK